MIGKAEFVIEKKRNKEINKSISREKKNLSKNVTLLLLGAGESGKSTIAKQFRIINEEDFSDEERKHFKEVINNNVIETTKQIIQQAKKYKYKFTEKKTSNYLQSFSESTINDTFVKYLKKVSKEEAWKKTISKGSEYQLLESAEYFLSAETLDRIKEESYTPSNDDIVRSRQQTTGIIETTFEVETLKMRLIDVGGQRNERRKWIHVFEGVTAVIFCVALSGYHSVLREDASTNRMHEALDLFEQICNSKWFRDTHIILFLNKKDIFEERIKEVDLNVCFPDYSGGKDYDAAVKFIEKRFLLRNKHKAKIVYPHITCATDTSNIKAVFKAVKGIIMHRALNSSGLL